MNQQRSLFRRSLQRRAVSRGVIFSILLLICLATAIGYVGWAMQRSTSGTAPASDPAIPIGQAGEAMSALPAEEPRLMFRNTALGDHFGMVALTARAEPDGPRLSTTLRCERVHFAAGQGICLIADRGVITTYSAAIFDADFQVRHSFALEGIPSRARVSPDGRLAAFTVFVSGHSYAADNFSTQTSIVDTLSGEMVVDNLEQFAVKKDDERFHTIDFNFWGVTFTSDSKHFYATLASGGQHYLIEGDVAAKQARVLAEQVECPSLSPDNTKIIYKKLERNHGWRLYVLDLATLATVPLRAETRSVDDQVEWLDDNHVLYVLADDSASATPGENVWITPVDGSEAPRIFIPRAASPTVIGR